MNKDQIKGRIKEAVGKAEKELGDILDDPEHLTKGVARETEGKLEKARGDAEEKARKETMEQLRHDETLKRHQEVLERDERAKAQAKAQEKGKAP